jgi:osmotically-inducible protein OsmY
MLVMDKNRQKRNRTSYGQDEYRNQDRDRRYDFDNDFQRTNYGNENTQRNYGQRNSDYYGPDYGNDYGQDLNRGQQNRGAYDQSRWPNDNNYSNNRQSDQFNRYQDYDRGFNNLGGHGGNSYNYPSGRQHDRGQGLTRNNNFNSQRNWNYGTDYRDSSAGLGYGGTNYSGNYGNESQQRNTYGNSNRGYNDYNQRNQQDRSWWDRSRDEVSSWFGDDEAEHRRRMDEMQRRSHKGKGPKDYQRSESRIREDVSDRLSDDHDLDASDIDVKVSGNEVILSGTVEDRDAKRRAEDIAESVSGVSNVQNQLKIAQSSIGSSSSFSSSGKEKQGNSLKTEKMHHN